jgi:hypothetical protein
MIWTAFILLIISIRQSEHQQQKAASVKNCFSPALSPGLVPTGIIHSLYIKYYKIAPSF